MKALLWCVFCGAMAAQGQPARESLCSVEGKVVSESTGKPLPDATLTLRRPGAAQSIFTTISDDSGKFAFAGIEAGKYSLRAERMGYVAANYGAKRPIASGTLLGLATGQNATGVDFKLKPQGVIAGRVFDADGEPVQYSPVKLMRQRYVNGKKRLSAVDAGEVANYRGNLELTNDQGEYRFFGLAPGRYYVSANTGGSETERVSQDRSAKAPAAYVETFHPSAVDAQKAEPVEVSAGKIAPGIDVALSRAPMARIRGRVVNLADVAANGSVMVQIYRADGALVGGARLGPQGEFDISARASEGRSWFVTRVQSGAASYFSKQPLLLSGGPMDDVLIALNAGIPLRGSVRVEDGGAVRVDLRTLRVSLAPSDLEINGLPAATGAVGADGSFTAGNISPGRYLLTVGGLTMTTGGLPMTVGGLPNGVYVKSIRMGDEDVLENGLDLSQESGAPLEILLSAKAGAVEGSVMGDNDAPAAGVTVALVPQSAKRRERPDWYRSATTDQNGGFALAVVPPGEYKLFAWEDVEDTAWMDPEFLKAFESLGKTVTVREGGSEIVEFKVIP